MKNYVGSLTGGSTFGVCFGDIQGFSIDPTRLLETVLMAAIGALVGFFVQKGLQLLFKKKAKK